MSTAAILPQVFSAACFFTDLSMHTWMMQKYCQCYTSYSGHHSLLPTAYCCPDEEVNGCPFGAQIQISMAVVFFVSKCLDAGKYELTREKVEFSQYMREEGYHIIPIKPEHQLVRMA